MTAIEDTHTEACSRALASVQLGWWHLTAKGHGWCIATAQQASCTLVHKELTEQSRECMKASGSKHACLFADLGVLSSGRA